MRINNTLFHMLVIYEFDNYKETWKADMILNICLIIKGLQQSILVLNLIHSSYQGSRSNFHPTSSPISISVPVLSFASSSGFQRTLMAILCMYKRHTWSSVPRIIIIRARRKSSVAANTTQLADPLPFQRRFSLTVLTCNAPTFISFQHAHCTPPSPP